MEQIATKWHYAWDLIKNKRTSLNTGYTTKGAETSPRYADGSPRMFKREEVLLFLSLVDDMPKFVIDSKLMASLQKEDLGKSVKPMVNAGMTRLPFPQQMVEFDFKDETHDYRVMLVLTERKNEFIQEFETKWHPYRAFLVWIRKYPGGEDYLVFSPWTYLVDFDMDVEKSNNEFIAANPDVEVEQVGRPDGPPSDEPEFGVRYMALPAPYIDIADLERTNKKTNHWQLQMVFHGLCSLILLTKTKGVDKEFVPPPEKLNKARAKKDRAPVPAHTVIKIGHVYRKINGQMVRQNYDGVHLPVWVRGHYRNVPHGPRRALRREQFIEPFLRYYEEGGDTPDYQAMVTP